MSQQTDRLKQRLAAIPAAVKAATVPALLKSAGELADGMKALVPVRTGALRDSIVVTPPGGTTPAYSQPGGARIAAENQAFVTAGNTEVRYSAHVEYGTRKMHAEPFFWPAYRLLKKRIQSRMKRAVSQAVKTEWET